MPPYRSAERETKRDSGSRFGCHASFPPYDYFPVLERSMPDPVESADSREPDPSRPFGGGSDRTLRSSRRSRSGSRPRSTWSRRMGVPAAQACGRAAVGYAIGNGVSDRAKPGEDLGELVVEVRRRLGHPAHDPVGLVRARTGPGQGRSASCRAARPCRCGSERAVAGVGGGHRPNAPAGQSLSLHEPAGDRGPRSSGTMPLQSRWPMFEVSESTRCFSPSSASA